MGSTGDSETATADSWAGFSTGFRASGAAGFAVASTSAGATATAFGGSGLGWGGVVLEQPITAAPQNITHHWIDGICLITNGSQKKDTQSAWKDGQTAVVSLPG